MELVQNLVKHCKILGAILSIELHYLDSPLEHFPENLGDVIDEQGLIFHQDIREMQSKLSKNMGPRYDGRLLLVYEKR